MSGLEPMRCGFMDYLNNWDHRVLWMDFDEKFIFGYRGNLAVPATARRCLLNKIKLVKNYKKGVKEKYK